MRIEYVGRPDRQYTMTLDGQGGLHVMQRVCVHSLYGSRETIHEYVVPLDAGRHDRVPGPGYMDVEAVLPFGTAWSIFENGRLVGDRDLLSALHEFIGAARRGERHGVSVNGVALGRPTGAALNSAPA